MVPRRASVEERPLTVWELLVSTADQEAEKGETAVLDGVAEGVQPGVDGFFYCVLNARHLGHCPMGVNSLAPCWSVKKPQGGAWE